MTPSVSTPKDQAREDERVEKGKRAHHAHALELAAARLKADGRPANADSCLNAAAYLRALSSPADPVRAALEEDDLSEATKFTNLASGISDGLKLRGYVLLGNEEWDIVVSALRRAALSVSTPTGEGNEMRWAINEMADAAFAVSSTAPSEAQMSRLHSAAEKLLDLRDAALASRPVTEGARQRVDALLRDRLFRWGWSLKKCLHARLVDDLVAAALAHPPQAGERNGPPTPRAVSQEKFERVYFALEELIECAGLRGDNELPHPADDPKLWTSRMQEAWSEAQAALDETSETALAHPPQGGERDAAIEQASNLPHAEALKQAFLAGAMHVRPHLFSLLSKDNLEETAEQHVTVLTRLGKAAPLPPSESSGEEA